MRVNYKLLQGDCRETLKSLADESVDCCITSPPYYGLRDYGTGHFENGVYVDYQIGKEQTPEEFISELVKVFHEVKRVLKSDGTLWVNIGDTYNCSGYNKKEEDYENRNCKQSTNKGIFGAGTENHNVSRPFDKNCKEKDLIGIPWMLAFALRQDGWYLRQDIVWAKTNSMPEPVKDRCTKSHEYIFLLSKSKTYFFDADAIKTPCSESTEKRVAYGWHTDSPSVNYAGISVDVMGDRFAPSTGANRRDVWFMPNSSGFKDHNCEHYATFPEDLAKLMVLAGCKEGGAVLDPFNGSGTTGVVAMRYGRNYIGCELSEKFTKLSEDRLNNAWEASPSLF